MQTPGRWSGASQSNLIASNTINRRQYIKTMIASAVRHIILLGRHLVRGTVCSKIYKSPTGLYAPAGESLWQPETSTYKHRRFCRRLERRRRRRRVTLARNARQYWSNYSLGPYRKRCYRPDASPRHPRHAPLSRHPRLRPCMNIAI